MVNYYCLYVIAAGNFVRNHSDQLAPFFKNIHAVFSVVLWLQVNVGHVIQKTPTVLNQGQLSLFPLSKCMGICAYSTSVDVSLFCTGCCPIGGPGPQETALAVWAADGEPAQRRGRLVQRRQVCLCVCVCVCKFVCPSMCTNNYTRSMCLCHLWYFRGFWFQAALVTWADVCWADVLQ